MAGSSEPAFLFLSIKMELLLHRLFIYFATPPEFFQLSNNNFRVADSLQVPTYRYKDVHHKLVPFLKTATKFQNY